MCEMRSKRLDEFLASGKMLLVLDRVTDPGNIGTMLRTADAAGVGGLLLLQGCADIYAPKTRACFHGLAIPPAGAERFERGAVGAGST